MKNNFYFIWTKNSVISIWRQSNTSNRVSNTWVCNFHDILLEQVDSERLKICAARIEVLAWYFVFLDQITVCFDFLDQFLVCFYIFDPTNKVLDFFDQIPMCFDFLDSSKNLFDRPRIGKFWLSRSKNVYVSTVSTLGFNHFDFTFWFWVRLCCKFVLDFGFRPSRLFIWTLLDLSFDFIDLCLDFPDFLDYQVTCINRQTILMYEYQLVFCDDLWFENKLWKRVKCKTLPLKTFFFLINSFNFAAFFPFCGWKRWFENWNLRRIFFFLSQESLDFQKINVLPSETLLNGLLRTAIFWWRSFPSRNFCSIFNLNLIEIFWKLLHLLDFTCSTFKFL